MSVTTRVSVGRRCVLCTVVLTDEYDVQRGLCANCQKRPEARQLRITPRPAAPANGGARAARTFTPAERSLIRNMHGYLPARELLRILNERLAADLGPDASPYTIEMLQAELKDAIEPGPSTDWADLRRVLAQARKAGLLPLIGPTVIDDFAVVYQLTPAQHMHLRDVWQHAWSLSKESR